MTISGIADPHVNASHECRKRMGCTVWQNAHQGTCQLPECLCRELALVYATATFKVLNAYTEWSNGNHVMNENEVKDPMRTLKIAVMQCGCVTTVAALFFGNLWRKGGEGAFGLRRA
ncbi:hypothetical protein BDZ97DRAFT_1763870 [Flammula alnicola]|nr:hypothetical protein BDZ97DRAFT_1763870 [Flammula alnicola]